MKFFSLSRSFFSFSSGLLLLLFYVSCSNANSVVGFWKTIDDATNKPRSIIEIVTTEDGSLAAFVREIIEIEGQPSRTHCEKCKGTLQNKPIIGLRVAWDLQADGVNQWDSGEILDPTSGKIYSCRMTLNNSGDQLKVRGFLGLSLFGRTQTWHRAAR